MAQNKEQQQEQQQQRAEDRLAADVKTEKIEFLWKERIPKGKITIVAGNPDMGKGLFAAHVAAQVSKRSNVLYSAAEDDTESMTKPRLEAAGANLKRIIFPGELILPGDFATLREKVRNAGIRLVVLDPFGAHLAGVNRTGDNIRKVTGPLHDLARETGCAILIIEHVIKKPPKNGHPLQAIGGGSSGLRAAARAGYIFGADPADTDRRLLACCKLNIAEKPKALEFEMDTTEIPIAGWMPTLVLQRKPVEFDPMQLLHFTSGDRKPGPNPTKRAAACEWITKYLVAAGKPVRSKIVLEDAVQAGHAQKTMRRAAIEMEVVKDPPGGGPNVTWEVDADVKAAYEKHQKDGNDE